MNLDVLITIIIFCKEINSIMFFLNFLVFTLALKCSLYYVDLNINIIPEIECCFDIEENNKFTF